MNIPDEFVTAIKNKFYDKEIELYSTTEILDSEGFVRRGSAVLTGSFMANVSYDKLDKVQEEYGIDEEISMTITTDEDVSNNQLIKFRGEYMKIVKAIANDSHNFLIAVKCSLRSLTSISA